MTYQNLRRSALSVTLLAVGCAHQPQPTPAPTESWYQQSERRREAYRAHVLEMADVLTADYQDFVNKRGNYARATEEK